MLPKGLGMAQQIKSRVPGDCCAKSMYAARSRIVERFSRLEPRDRGSKDLRFAINGGRKEDVTSNRKVLGSRLKFVGSFATLLKPNLLLWGDMLGVLQCLREKN